MKPLEDCTDFELYLEAYCGLVCPFPILHVPAAMGTPAYHTARERQAALHKRQLKAAQLLYEHRGQHP